MIDLAAVESELGYEFTETTNAMVALRPSVQGFSRLEFLGDSILGLVVFTLAECGGAPRQAASRMVSNAVLDEIFRSRFAPYCNANTGDVIEALIGAIYLYAGFEVTARTISSSITPEFGIYEPEGIPVAMEQISARGRMYLGATASRAVVSDHLCRTFVNKNHQWFSEQRAAVLKSARLAEIARTDRLCPPLMASSRNDDAAADYLDERVGQLFLALGWGNSRPKILELLRLPHGVTGGPENE